MSGTTFAMYEIYGKQTGSTILKTPSDEHNLDEFREKLKENPDIIFLCLPNNPVGECLDWEDVKRFIDEVDEEADCFQVSNNYISITPTHFDLTSYKAMDELKNWDIPL